MKRSISFATFVILASLFTCKPIVTFNEPQPVDTDNLSKFPKRLQGQYINLSDSSTLIIGAQLIQRIYDYDYKIDSNHLDSTSRLSGDTLIDLRTNKRRLIKRDGDSLITHVRYIDTLFLMNYDNVVRKLKGYYFLNIRYDETSWAVQKMHLSKGQLTISSISTKQDIDNLKEITETPTDTVLPYKITATKKQFKEFIKNDGFSDSDIYVRQRKNVL